MTEKMKNIYKKSLAMELIKAGHNFNHSMRNRENPKYQVYVFKDTPELVQDMLKFNRRKSSVKYIYDKKLQRPLKILNNMAQNDVDEDYHEYNLENVDDYVLLTHASYTILVDLFKTYYPKDDQFTPESIRCLALKQINEELNKYGL